MPDETAAADGNEECCGGCKMGGDLICCEGCPAAFHAECAGYHTIDELPPGDWLCWFCAKEQGKRYQHPTTQFQHAGGLVHIFLAVDDRAEVFRRAKLLHASDKYMEVACTDVQAEPEVVAKTSPRLWHGTANQAAWTRDADGIHWRPNCRLFKVDRAALAALQEGAAAAAAPHQGPHAASNSRSNTNSRSRNANPAAAAAGDVPNGTAAAARTKLQLKLHFKGLKGAPASQQQQPQQQQDHPPAASGGRQRPPTAPGPVRLSVPPGPSTLQPAGDSGSLLSPDSSAGGPSPGGRDWSAALAKAEESAARRGVGRIPEGQIGAGLPLIQGGAGKEAFDAALHQFWAERSAATGERVPSPIFVGATLVEPWHFWREVWAWGGPEEVSRMKLWATVGHCFNPPAGATSISSRMRGHYDTMFAPFDKAIDAGQLRLQRPTPDRQSTDRWLQTRVYASTSGRTVSRGSRPTLATLQGAPSSQPGSRAASPTTSNGAGAIAAAAAAGAAPGAVSGGGPGVAANGSSDAAAAAAAQGSPGPGGGQGAGAAGSGKQRRQRRPRQQQQQQRRKPGPKRRRPVQWSDNDEDDYIAAVSSDGSDEELMQGSDDEEGGLQPLRLQQQQQQHKAVRELGSSTGANSGGSPGSKRLRISMKEVARGLVADGLDSAGGYEYLRQPTDLVVLGKIQLTPAAQRIQVGDCVDFRQPSSSGTCVTGWRSGIVLAIAPGSEWEGGRRLLIKPRHTHHSHLSQQQHNSTPSLPSDTPAAAALAAVAAAGGPTGGTAAEAAAHKLLTPGGHLRHEVAALLPARSGSVKPASAGDAPPSPSGLGAAAATSGSSQQQQQQLQRPAGPSSGLGAAADEPQWVPMVWRGDCWQPFLAPPVLVRPHYAPTTSLVVGAAAAAGGAGAGAGAGAGPSTSPFASPTQQGQQQELRVGGHVEVLREGCWCPAQVLEVAPGAGGPGAACVVLRSVAPPEGDGGVWRCSGTHPIRPIHPRYTSGCGVVQCAGPEELVSVAAMKKAMAPYMYSEGIHAFACIHHMRAAASAAAAAQG